MPKISNSVYIAANHMARMRQTDGGQSASMTGEPAICSS